MGFWSSIGDGFDWAGRRLFLTAPGYVASWVGKEDTAEFLWSAGNPSYTPKTFRQASITDEERKTLSKEDQMKLIKERGDDSNRFTEKVVKEIAPATETVLATGVQGLAAVPGAMVGGPTGALLMADLAEMGMDIDREVRGDAPIRTLNKTYLPSIKIPETVPVIGGGNIMGDDHYGKGGSTMDHPNIARHREMIAKARQEAYAERGSDANGQPLNPSAQTTAEKPSQPTPQTKGKSGPTGTQSILGALGLGLIGFLLTGFNPIGGIIGAVAGGLAPAAIHALGGFLTKSGQTTDSPQTSVPAARQKTSASAEESHSVPGQLPSPVTPKVNQSPVKGKE